MELDDAIPFAIMTADGTLNDCSIGKDCSNWIIEWITEAKDIALRVNPNINDLAYTITLKEGTVVVWSCWMFLL